MRVLQACSGAETRTVRTGTIKRLIRLVRRYLEHRNRWRTFRDDSAENRIVSRYEGRRWCDATERALIGDITNRHGSHLLNTERELP